MGPDGTSKIVEALIKNVSVKDLNLEGNNFGNRGAFIIGEYIRKTHVLMSLNLSLNFINQYGIKKIVDGMKFNKSIKSLILCNF